MSQENTPDSITPNQAELKMLAGFLATLLLSGILATEHAARSKILSLFFSENSVISVAGKN